MRRLLTLLPAVLFTTLACAAPGDTTKVQTFAGLQMDHYGAFDTTVAFPDGSVSYRKILMTFTLGKYQCPPSPPNNYCGDWDYDVHMFIMTKTGDTLEIGRFITPYAKATYPRTPWTWKQRYQFDVTDFYHQLKDSATVRIFYSGYSWGFTADVRFDFIEGIPPRSVIDIDRAWAGGYTFGDNSQDIESKIDTKAFAAPNGTQYAELLFEITGHGSDDNGCSEFCRKFYEVELNGNKFDKTDIWRDDCGYNHMYPQSGTWVYDRGNWCPGDIAFPNRHKLSGISGGGNFNLDVDFQTYTGSVTQGGSWGSYNIQSAVIYYGAFNKNVDASLDDIIAPSDHETHFRYNPFTGKPLVRVQNTGSTTISSIKFRYEVNTRGAKEYTWQGTLAALETADIELDLLSDLQEISGNNHTFKVEIIEVNGAADGDATNNKMSSNFKAAITLPSELSIELKTNLGTAAGVSQSSWQIIDLSNNNVVAQRVNCAPNTTYKDSFILNQGMYKLVVEDAGCNGLRWWANPGDGNGEFYLYRRETVIPVALPGYFSGDFGCGFTHYFNILWPQGVKEVNISPEITVYPNPAGAQLTVALGGIAESNGILQVVDMMGRVVLQQAVNNLSTVVNTSGIANGVYTVIYRDTEGNSAKLKSRVVIAR